MDIEGIDTNMNDSRAAIKQKFKLVRLQLVRKADFGISEETIWVNCHLGELITYNDTVLGYDLERINVEEIDHFRQKTSWMPEVIVVKKGYSKSNKRRHRRNWKLKQLKKEEVEQPDEEKTKMGRKDKQLERNKQLRDQDYEIFMQDLEEDKEYRQGINLYKEEHESEWETDGEEEEIPMIGQDEFVPEEEQKV